MKKEIQKLASRGAYLHKMKGGATRGGTHKNKKREASRMACRKG